MAGPVGSHRLEVRPLLKGLGTSLSSVSMEGNRYSRLPPVIAGAVAVEKPEIAAARCASRKWKDGGGSRFASVSAWGVPLSSREGKRVQRGLGVERLGTLPDRLESSLDSEEGRERGGRRHREEARRPLNLPDTSTGRVRGHV